MPWPKISIVTPSYNQGNYIERTVRSVLLQRYPNLEYILMDGGSTDDTLERLRPYQDNFSYFVSEPDHGQADAIAKGFARSSGEIMAYLNSDDLLAPDTLHFVARFFSENPKIDWIYSHRCTVDENDQVIWYWILPPHQSFLMRRWDYIPQETCFWRRSLFEKTGNIDRSYRFAMDYDLFVRFMNRGHGRRLNRFLGVFRDHGTSKTKQLLETVGAQEMLRVRRKFMIRAALTDGIFGLLIGNWVRYVGRYFAAVTYSLPGALPGVGYDYNEVWGGLLRPGAGRSVDPARTDLQEGFYSPLCPVTLGLADRLLFRASSTRDGRGLTKDIYLNSKSRVAIIAPSANDKNEASVSDQLFGKEPVADRFTDVIRANLANVASSVIGSFDRLTLNAVRADATKADYRADQLLRLTQGFVSKNQKITFLETSCFTGELLDALKARTKWSLFGLETNSSAAAEAISKGHCIIQSTLRQAPAHPETVKGFDLIYLGQGIQCFDEPRASLRAIAILLKIGGLLALSTPNLDSEQRKLFGSAWAQWRPDTHRFIFSRNSLDKLFEQAGFVAKKIQTISNFESTALSLENFHDRFPSDAGRAKAPKMLETMQAEKIVRVNRLFWDKFGKGDEILAVFRRVS